MPHEQFERLGQVAQHMPAVSYLNGMWSSCSGPFCKATGTITTDDLDARVRTKPGSKGLSQSIGQQVDYAMLFQITQDRTIGTPLAPGSGKRMALPPFPPLRTGQVSFLTSGSSLSLRPCYRTRLSHENALAMNLLMARWMEQYTVFCGVPSPF